MSSMTKRERVDAALNGERVDRVPFAFWGHHPQVDRTVDGLVKAELDWYRQYDLDFIKVMFRSSFFREDYGQRFEHYKPSSGSWTAVNTVVNQPEDWANLPLLDPTQGALGEQLAVLRAIRQGVGNDTSVLTTLFSPLMVAGYLAGEQRLLEHIRTQPDALHAGLARIASSVETFAAACLQNGADGAFYATQYASANLLSAAEFAEFETRYSVPILDTVADSSLFIMLHLHGRNILFEQAMDWPVDALNWYDRDTAPTLAEGRERSGKCVMGGLDHEGTLVTGPASAIAAAVQDAMSQCGGVGIMITPGCGIPLNVPPEHLTVARRAVGAL